MFKLQRGQILQNESLSCSSRRKGGVESRSSSVRRSVRGGRSCLRRRTNLQSRGSGCRWVMVSYIRFCQCQFTMSSLLTIYNVFSPDYLHCLLSRLFTLPSLQAIYIVFSPGYEARAAYQRAAGARYS